MIERKKYRHTRPSIGAGSFSVIRKYAVQSRTTTKACVRTQAKRETLTSSAMRNKPPFLRTTLRELSVPRNRPMTQHHSYHQPVPTKWRDKKNSELSHRELRWPTAGKAQNEQGGTRIGDGNQQSNTQGAFPRTRQGHKTHPKEHRKLPGQGLVHYPSPTSPTAAQLETPTSG
jgi:hypothetical protein